MEIKSPKVYRWIRKDRYDHWKAASYGKQRIPFTDFTVISCTISDISALRGLLNRGGRINGGKVPAVAAEKEPTDFIRSAGGVVCIIEPSV